MTCLIGRSRISPMVPAGLVLGLVFLLLKLAAVEGLSDLTDAELKGIIKGRGRECNGCNRDELLKLASELSEEPQAKHRDKNGPAAGSGDAEEASFEEIQNLLDELREKIESEAKEPRKDASPPSPGELDTMAKELREEFLNAVKGGSPPSSENSGKEKTSLGKLSEDDARFKAHKAMSGSHVDDEEPRKVRRPQKETLQGGDYLEIAKTLSRKYLGILQVNLRYYSRVGAALGREYGSLSMSYASRFTRSVLHYSKIYGSLTFDKSARFTRYVYRKARSAGSQLWAKLAKK